MDEESWFITLSTAIGGFVGWRSAKQRIDEKCTLEYLGERVCAPLNDEMYIEEYVSWVYPSSILTGLAFGLLAGALLVGAWKLIKMSNKSDD